MTANSKYLILILFIIGIILGHIIYFGIKSNIEMMYPNIFSSNQVIDNEVQINLLQFYFINVYPFNH